MNMAPNRIEIGSSRPSVELWSASSKSTAAKKEEATPRQASQSRPSEHSRKSDPPQQPRPKKDWKRKKRKRQPGIQPKRQESKLEESFRNCKARSKAWREPKSSKSGASSSPSKTSQTGKAKSARNCMRFSIHQRQIRIQEMRPGSCQKLRSKATSQS